MLLFVSGVGILIGCMYPHKQNMRLKFGRGVETVAMGISLRAPLLKQYGAIKYISYNL